jgi:hypothetical protein
MSLRSTALALTLVWTAGCAQTFDATSLGVPVTMAVPAGEQPPGEHFKVNQSSVFVFWGLLTLTTPSLEKVIATQLVGGRSVSNVKIRISSRWSDILITGLTLGIVVPRTVTFEGNVSGATPAPAQPPPD